MFIKLHVQLESSQTKYRFMMRVIPHTYLEYVVGSF